MDDEVRQQMELLRKSGEWDELYHVTSYVGYRVDPNGYPRKVRVEIWDAGPDNTLRYQVVATDEFGHEARSNAGPDLVAEIRDTHWNELEGPIPEQ